MMDARGVRNMYSILVVVNKNNTARDASCWFIVYYRLVMHGNSNIKKTINLCLPNVFTRLFFVILRIKTMTLLKIIYRIILSIETLLFV